MTFQQRRLGAFFAARSMRASAYFDTAPLYGHGKSEMRLGRGLAGEKREDYVLATKVGRLLEPVELGELKPDEFDHPAPFRPVFNFS